MRLPTRRLRLENLESRRLLAAVSIPDDLVGQVGAEVAAPVRIDSAQGVRGAEIRIQYDPALLTLTPEDVTAGSAWQSMEDTQVVANVDQATGTVTVFVSASAGLPDVEGSLVIFAFVIRDQATPGTQSAIDLVEVKLNEGAIAVNPAPLAGADPTDGSILIGNQPGDSDRIGGFVYADTNGDKSPGSLEGIPGVVITLVNVQSGAQRQTTTDASGAFEFTQVAAGNYRLVQTQPLAYLEGGPNERTVELLSGQNVQNQNFRELGLRAAFVYNRLLTTAALPVGSPPWVEVLQRINADAASSIAPQANSAVASSDLASGERFAAASANSPAAEAEGETENSSRLASSAWSEPDSSAEGESWVDDAQRHDDASLRGTDSPAATQQAENAYTGLVGTPYQEPQQDEEEDGYRSVDQALADVGLW